MSHSEEVPKTGSSEPLPGPDSPREGFPASTLLLRAILETAPDGFWILDSAGKLVDVNPAYCAMLGYERGELLGSSIGELDADETPAETAERVRNVMANGSGVFEVRHRRKDGSIIPVEVSATWVEEGPGWFVCFGRNLEGRAKREEAFRRSEAKYRTLFDQSADAIYVHDLDGKILDVNQEALAQSGYSRGELLDLTVFDFLPDSIVMEEVIRQWKSWKPGHHFVIGEHHIGKDGVPYPVEIKTAKVEFDGEELMLAVVRDLTERERLENQLRQAQKMEAVGRLAGGIAHDFNNMLNVILGHAELGLAGLPPGHPLRSDLLEIQEAGGRSAELTSQLLAFARRQAVEPQVVDLNQAVESLLRMLRRLIGEDVELRWDPAQALPPIHIDPTQVDQLLANLVVNARDAIGDGGGRITIETADVELGEDEASARPALRPGRFVLLTVSDDGCGMDEVTRAQVFEPFFTTKERGKGTGLGLSTVYGIVAQNDGMIDVFSEAGEGATFRIYLPAYAPGDEGGRPVSEESFNSSVARGEETVLLVEDEPAILTLAERMLEKLGYEVLTASSPGEAMEVARDHPGQIKLLATDVVMPEMSGRDLARELTEWYPDLKTLFISGYTADVIANEGVLEEGVNFLQKPFTLNSLGGKVRAVLDG